MRVVMFFILLIIKLGFPTLYKAYEFVKSLFRPFRGDSHRTSKGKNTVHFAEPISHRHIVQESESSVSTLPSTLRHFTLFCLAASQRVLCLLLSTKILSQDTSKAIQQAMSATMMNNGTDNFEGGVPAGWVREFWVYVFLIWFSVNMIIIICLWPFRDWTELL
ncbi:hypothetical protein GGI43DRAFT_432813 [Trichoderma evansii]